MSIQFDESIMGIWYVLLTPKFDVMLALQREGKGYKYLGRTRTYNSDDPFDEKDKKQWFEAKDCPDVTTDEDALGWARKFMIETAANFSAVFPLERVKVPMVYELVRGDKTPEQFAEHLMSMPWAHHIKKSVH